MPVYIATIQIAVKADDPIDAIDGISETLGDAINWENPTFLLDWQYMKVGGQWLYPTEVHPAINEPYREGDAFR